MYVRTYVRIMYVRIIAFPLIFRDCYLKCMEVLQKMEETEEVKQSKFMTYLNLSSVVRKIGNNGLCEDYMKLAEAMIKDLFENSPTNDLYDNSLLVSSYTYI